jgi:hypothetical protein
MYTLLGKHERPVVVVNLPNKEEVGYLIDSAAIYWKFEQQGLLHKGELLTVREASCDEIAEWARSFERTPPLEIPSARLVRLLSAMKRRF